MSLIKRYIDEQMEIGNDLLHAATESLDNDYRAYVKQLELEKLKSEVFKSEIDELELSNCCGSKMAGADYGIPTDICLDCGEHSVTLNEELTYELSI